MCNLEQLVRRQFGRLDYADIEDIVSEARTIQFERYKTLLDDQAMCHCKKMIMEAARNLDYLDKEVNIGGYGSEKAVIHHSSLDFMTEESGFEVAAEEDVERPEEAVDRIIRYLPDGPAKQVFCMLLNEEVDSIESAASVLNLSPQRVFDALKKIGALVTGYNGLEDGMFLKKCDDQGLRKAIQRVCDKLVPRSHINSWSQTNLFPA
jgi:hypothetical protein